MHEQRGDSTRWMNADADDLLWLGDPHEGCLVSCSLLESCQIPS